MTARTGEMTSMSGKFLGLFVLYLVIFVAVAQLSQSLYKETAKFTAIAAAAFWKMFYLPVSSAGTNVTFYDFTMEIIFECTGMHYIAIFGSAVFASRGRSLQDKAAGLFAGISMIFLLNLLRLGMLGIVGHFMPALFLFTHLYLWHGLFGLFVLLLWALWLNGKMRISRLFALQIVASVASATLIFWLFFANIGFYFTFLAALADGIFPLFSGILEMPRIVIAQGELIGYVAGDYVIYSKTGLYVLNWAVFFALAVAAFVRSEARRLFAKRLALGIGLMILSHLCMLFMDWSLEVTSSGVLDSVLRWGIVMSSMSAPLIVWGIVNIFYRSRDTGDS